MQQPQDSKVNEISQAEVNRRMLIIINALLKGHQLQYDRWTVCLNNAYQVCVPAYDGHGNLNGKLIPFNFGRFTLTDFMEWAEDMTPDEVDTIVANIGLNEVNKNDKR